MSDFTVRPIDPENRICMQYEHAKTFLWGTRGKMGREPLRMVELGDCTTNHLINIKRHIIQDQKRSEDDEYVIAIETILEYRKPKLPEDLFEI